MRKKLAYVSFLAVTGWMLYSALPAEAATRCFTYRINYPSGEKRCGVRCEDNTTYPMDCGADIFKDGFDQEYPLKKIGTSGSDHLLGTASADFMSALSANDALVGLSGEDWLEGGAGNDALNGGPGDDLLFGEDGDDQYFYGIGDGTDVIMDSLGANRLTLDWALSAGLTTGQSGNDLVLYVSSGSAVETITILNFYTTAVFTIDFASPATFPH